MSRNVSLVVLCVAHVMVGCLLSPVHAAQGQGDNAWCDLSTGWNCALSCRPVKIFDITVFYMKRSANEVWIYNCKPGGPNQICCKYTPVCGTQKFYTDSTCTALDMSQPFSSSSCWKTGHQDEVPHCGPAP